MAMGDTRTRTVRQSVMGCLYEGTIRRTVWITVRRTVSDFQVSVEAFIGHSRHTLQCTDPRTVRRCVRGLQDRLN